MTSCSPEILSDVVSFLEVPAFIPSNGISPLRSLLNKHGMDAAECVLALATSNVQLARKFMKRTQDYPEGKETLMGSPYVREIFAHGNAVLSCIPAQIDFDLGSNEDPESLKFVLAEILSKAHNLDIVENGVLLEIIPQVVVWISMENIGISNSAVDLLYRISQSDISACKSVVMSTMQYCNEHEGSISTTQLLRYFSFISKIMECGPEAYSVCALYGCPAAIMKVVETPDILVQMVALDLVPSLSATPQGLAFLTSEKHLLWLVDACSASSGAMEELIRTQCLSTAAMVLRSVELCNHEYRADDVYAGHVLPAFLKGVENALDSTDEPERAMGLSAIELFATSSLSAFKALVSCDTLIESCLQLLRGQPSVQGATLHCLGKTLIFPSEIKEDIFHGENDANGLFGVPPAPLPPSLSGSSDVDVLCHVSPTTLKMLQREAGEGNSTEAVVEELCRLKKGLFNRIGSAVGGPRGVPTMDYLMRLVKQPILEIKLGALDVLRALAYQETPWGLHKLIGHVAFYHFLKERTSEYSKEGKIWKFSLITAVAHSPHAGLLSSDVAASLETMLRQGPFFMPPAMEEPMTEEA